MKRILVIRGISAYDVLGRAADEICEGFRKCGYQVDMIGATDPGADDRFILCTDGFWRTEDEVALVQSWQFLMKTEEQIRKNMYKRVQKAMERGETDNITVIYIEQKEQ